MAACEWCWEEANRQMLLLGGSVAQRYEEVRREQDAMGKHALCQMARSAAGGCVEESDP